MIMTNKMIICSIILIIMLIIKHCNFDIFKFIRHIEN